MTRSGNQARRMLAPIRRLRRRSSGDRARRVRRRSWYSGPPRTRENSPESAASVALVPKCLARCLPLLSGANAGRRHRPEPHNLAADACPLGICVRPRDIWGRAAIWPGSSRSASRLTARLHQGEDEHEGPGTQGQRRPPKSSECLPMRTSSRPTHEPCQLARWQGGCTSCEWWRRRARRPWPRRRATGRARAAHDSAAGEIPWTTALPTLPRSTRQRRAARRGPVERRRASSSLCPDRRAAGRNARIETAVHLKRRSPASPIVTTSTVRSSIAPFPSAMPPSARDDRHLAQLASSGRGFAREAGSVCW